MLEALDFVQVDTMCKVNISSAKNRLRFKVSICKHPSCERRRREQEKFCGFYSKTTENIYLFYHTRAQNAYRSLALAKSINLAPPTIGKILAKWGGASPPHLRGAGG